MKATVKLEEGMVFTGSADSGFELRMDSSPSVGGQDSGFRPMELLLIGLGGCTAMDVISILRKKRQGLSGLELQLNTERSKEHPHVFTHIAIHYVLRGQQIDPKAVERSIELSETKYCSAIAMLSKAAPIDLTYEIVEE